MFIIKKIISKLKRLSKTFLNINQSFDQININQGIILSNLNLNKSAESIREYEFKVFSQWGEDGIIQRLINSIEIKNKTFIEFGVEDFFESNCRFLLMKDNWEGFVIDGSSKNINYLKNSYFYWKYNLRALDKFITQENINDILSESNFDEDLGILSIDIDGNDYFILESIKVFKPRILICEFNSVFGPYRKISIPYKKDFYRTDAHYSNLYWGASLGAINHIANNKGYSLVGTNTASCNAFFIRNDLVNEKVKVVSVEEAYSPSTYRESRDKKGKLNFIAADKRMQKIKGMPVFEVEKKNHEVI